MHSLKEGHQFEAILRTAAIRQGVHCIAMPLGARRVGRRLVPIKTPFDYILIHKGVCVYVDCKTYDTDSISFTRLTPHQIAALHTIQRFGCAGGYLIHFRKSSAVCFAHAHKLLDIQPGESMHGKDMIYLGQVEDFFLGRLFSLTWEKEWI